MPRPVSQSFTAQQLIKLLVEHRRVWIVPTVVFALLAGVLTFALPRKWKATQGMLIRPEAAGLGIGQLGKFADLTEMKTIQETLLELARSKTVVTSVLETVGPKPGWVTPKQWPTAEDVVDFRDSMVMTPPGGAEFGKTEVFYLGVLDEDPERAAALTTTLCEALESRAKEIRESQAGSMIAELSRGVEQAESELNAKIAELTAFESRVGADLSNLRSLVNPIGGTNETAQDTLAIHTEIRANEAERRRHEKLLEVLHQAMDDPNRLIATPNSLLASQPAVGRLKQGLVDAQLATARLLGKLSTEHPFVTAAQQAEEQVRQQLHQELAIAVSGVEMELALSDERDRTLKNRLTENQASQRNLAQNRAAYSQLVAAVENKTKLVDAARTRLADAAAQQVGAQSSSVLSRIDGVESSLRPVGPRRATVVAAGGLFGLLLGLGILFWQYGPEPKLETELNGSGSMAPATLRNASFGFEKAAPRHSSLSEAIASGFDTRQADGAR